MYSFWAPDDVRRIRLKHVEHFAEINGLYIKLHPVGYAWEYTYDVRTYERQINLYVRTDNGAKRRRLHLRHVSVHNRLCNKCAS
jgi:hypothetical protein